MKHPHSYSFSFSYGSMKKIFLYINELKILAIIITMCCHVPLLFAHPSLLFSEKEINLIHENFSGYKELETETSNSGDLYLSGIIYVDTKNWSLLLNDRVIRPDNVDQLIEFHIERVTPQMIKCSWLSDNFLSLVKFTLRPNQIFIAKEKRVVGK